MKKNISCSYFAKDGYCAKGSHCEFSHEGKKLPCRNFGTSQGCKYGDSCGFLHSKAQPKLRTQANVRYVSSAQKSVSTLPASPPPESSKLLEQERNIIVAASTSIAPLGGVGNGTSMESLWGLDPVANHSAGSEYYFGAVGGNASYLPEPAPPSFAAIAGQDISQSSSSAAVGVGITAGSNRFKGVNKSSTPCHFFAAGNCRFGSFCKNLHVLPDAAEPPQAHVAGITNSTDDFDNGYQDPNGGPFTDEVAQSTECGICMSKTPTAGGMYGILSHCHCHFCLTCIRDWRTKGHDVSSTPSQVRLCPLCRVQSYFIIPSMRLFPSGSSVEEKTALIDAYRLSLGTIPCRHEESGVCPFGTSCFYAHSYGTVQSRVLVNALSESSKPSQTQLCDLIMSGKGRNAVPQTRRAP